MEIGIEKIITMFKSIYRGIEKGIIKPEDIAVDFDGTATVSLYCTGFTKRINVHLSKDGTHIWLETYDYGKDEKKCAGEYASGPIDKSLTHLAKELVKRITEESARNLAVNTDANFVMDAVIKELDGRSNGR